MDRPHYTRKARRLGMRTYAHCYLWSRDMLSLNAARRKDARTGMAPMQHRHYATIAAIIAALPSAASRAEIARHFASRLADTNPKFDRARFIYAATGEG